MSQYFKALLITLTLLAGHASFAAEDIERGTEKEAVELVKKAVAYVKANGKEKAFAEISNPTGQFRNKDLFVAVYDFNGVNLAHGTNPRTVGKNLYEVKDVDGKLWLKDRINIAKAKGKGWQDYKFPNPVTKKVELKSSYFERIDDFIVNCGYNKPVL